MLRRVAVLASALLFCPLAGAAVLGRPARDLVVRTLRLAPHASYSAMIVDGSRHRAYVLNRLDDSVSLIDPRAGTLQRTVALGPRMSGVFATDLLLDAASGHLFVSSDDGTIHMLDARTLRPVSTTYLGEWTGPSLMALASRIGKLFVVGTVPGAHVVSLFDTRSGRLLRRLSGPDAYRGIALDRRGRLFAIGYGTDDVAVFDGTSAAPRRFRTIPGVPAGGFDRIAADSLSDLLYLASLYGDTVHVIEAATGALRPSIRVLGSVMAIAPTGVRDRVLIVDGAGMLSLADARSGRVLGAVRIGLGAALPYALDAGHGHLFAWVVSGAVEEIDLLTGRLLRTVRAGGIRPTQIAPNPLTGHLVLFYSGADDRAGGIVGNGSVRAVSLRGDMSGPNIPLGPVPELLGFDRRSRLMLVANASGDPRAADEPSRSGAGGGWVDVLRRWLPLFPAPLGPVPAGGTISVLDAARL